MDIKLTPEEVDLIYENIQEDHCGCGCRCESDHEDGKRAAKIFKKAMDDAYKG